MGQRNEFLRGVIRPVCTAALIGALGSGIAAGPAAGAGSRGMDTVWAGATSAGMPVPRGSLAAPLSFVPITGPHQEGNSFLAHASEYTAVIAPTSLQIAAAGLKSVRLSYLGTDPRASIAAVGRLPGVISSFRGPEPQQWRAGIPTYARLMVRDLYPGIDLVYYAGPNGLEYDLVVHPGADVRRIRIGIDGAIPHRERGNLVWRSQGTTLTLAAPTIYLQNPRRELAGGYRLDSGGALSFHLAAYDTRRTLVIDPYLKVIGTSGYNSIGGTGTAIATDSAGNIYITGTGSGQFPTTRGAVLTTLANQDVADSAIVVMKFNPAGTLLFSTYLGTVVGNGTTGVSSKGIAVDGAGNVYVTGATDGTNFPLVHPLISYPPPNGSGGSVYRAFVVKLNSTGSRVLYSTYLAGDLSSDGFAITVNRAGTAYIAGATVADENPDNKQFPVTAHKHACSPGIDGFVAMINPNGSKLLDAACIGGPGTTRATGIALDRAQNIYLTGYTNTFPPKANLRIVSQQPGVNNAFVIKYNPTETKVLYLAFLGAGSDSKSTAIAVDRAGEAFITGSTSAEDFPTTSGAFMRGQGAPNAGTQAAFAAAINAAGNHLLYSTYLSGNTDDAGTGIAVDKHGDAFVTGSIARNLNMAVSADQVTFPLTKGAMYTKFNINGDGFLTEINPQGTGVLSSTMLGGVVPTGLTLGPNGHPALTGSATRQDQQIAEAHDTWLVVWSL